MTTANSARLLLLCGALLAGRLGAQPTVVAELRVTAPSVLERTATIGSPAALRGLADLWVAEVSGRFGYARWQRADQAPTATARLLLTLSEERSQGCSPGRLVLTLAVAANAAATPREWSPGEGKSELKLPCDSDWQEEASDAFAADVEAWIRAVPFSPDGIEWIESALLRNVDLVSGIVADGEHLFLPVSQRTLKATRDSLIRVQFGPRERVDGSLWGLPCPGQGDRTQVLVTAFNCLDTTSSANFESERLGTGVVWHPLLQSVLQRCQSPVAVMWHYVGDGSRGEFAPSGPGASNLPGGGTALDPDGGR